MMETLANTKTQNPPWNVKRISTALFKHQKSCEKGIPNDYSPVAVEEKKGALVALLMAQRSPKTWHGLAAP